MTRAPNLLPYHPVTLAKRTLLGLVGRKRLLRLAQDFDIEVDFADPDALLEALAAMPASLEELLEKLNKKELHAACKQLSVRTEGNQREALATALVVDPSGPKPRSKSTGGTPKPPPTAPYTVGDTRPADALEPRGEVLSPGSSMPAKTKLDLDRLLKLRLVIARFGEMDLAKWWNTKGQLGRFGAAALRRGFPRTHRFAQARSVFAVAGHRCTEVFDPPNCVTLWSLPEAIEEEFDARWEHWLDNASDWTPFFEKLEGLQPSDLAATLQTFELVSAADVDACAKLRRSAEGRAVPLPGIFAGTPDDVALLALGFSRGEPASLAVPYARRPDA